MKHLICNITGILLVITSSIFLLASFIDVAYSQRTWYFDRSSQFALFIAFNIVFLLFVFFNSRLKDCTCSRLIFFILYFFLILDISKRFKYAYLINPFDTTGLRGLFSEILSQGRIPSSGFYVEYAGHYNKLFIGPLHTTIWMLVSNVNGLLDLDASIKFYEVILEISLYICFLLVVKELIKERLERTITLNLLLLKTFLAFAIFSRVLVLQAYAWPLLLLLIHLLIRILKRFDKSHLPLLIILNVTLVNTHSVSSLLYTLFASVMLIISFVIKEQYSRMARLVTILFIMIFFVKFIYDATRYFITFYKVGYGIIQNLLDMLFGNEPIMHPQIESALYANLTFWDYILLFFIRFSREFLIYFLIIISLIYSLYIISNFRSKINVNRSEKNHCIPKLLDISLKISATLTLLIQFAIFLQANVYTALSTQVVLLIFSLPSIICFLIHLKTLSQKALKILMLLIIVANIVAENTMLVPQINGQPLATYHIVNTIYKVNAISFVSSYLQSDIKLSSDIVTGWQVMGYAPQLFENYIWQSPIIYGLPCVKTVILLPTPDFKAGYLNEPLKYRINYKMFFENTIFSLDLIYSNDGVIAMITP